MPTASVRQRVEHAHLAFALAVQRVLGSGRFEAACWSPYSVACALGLAATGARGATRAELIALLHGDVNQEGSDAKGIGEQGNGQEGTDANSAPPGDGNRSSESTKQSAMRGGSGELANRSEVLGTAGDLGQPGVMAGEAGVMGGQAGDLGEHSAMLSEAAVVDSGRGSRGGGGPVLGVANTLWTRADAQIRPQFTAELGRWPGGRVRTAPFHSQPEAARRLINADVAETTHGLIRELLGPGTVTADTAATLVNALYLKVAWRDAFPQHATEPRPFHTAAGPVQVPTMRLPNKRLGYASADGWQVVVLPAAGDVEAVILLPDNTNAAAPGTASADPGGAPSAVASGVANAATSGVANAAAPAVPNPATPGVANAAPTGVENAAAAGVASVTPGGAADAGPAGAVSAAAPGVPNAAAPGIASAGPGGATSAAAPGVANAAAPGVASAAPTGVANAATAGVTSATPPGVANAAASGAASTAPTGVANAVAPGVASAGPVGAASGAPAGTGNAASTGATSATPAGVGGLAVAEAALDAGTLAALLAASTPIAVDLYLPRFAVRAKANLTSALAALGAPTMFSDHADFSGIADQAMAIAGVRHEAVLTVDEQGLEGAAATGMVVRALALRRDVSEPLVVRVDRPFLFLVRHRTSGAIYFLARITRP
ncbi:MAG TPA: serpin family protein [Pseudonocardiaceae bacterium]|nr:serpin family protein [Pseudonocardiaceae bacterium]